MPKTKMMKILFTGGGSGGHVFPIIAVVREIQRMMPQETKLYYLGPKDDWVHIYLSEEKIEINEISSGKIRRYFTPRAIALNILDLFRVVIGFFQSLFIIFRINPDLVFSKGGYGALPTVFAARILGIPIFMHESDISPGLVNRITSKLALEIFVAFEKTEYFKPEKMIPVGNPIRREVFSGGSEQGGKELIGLIGGKPIVFIIGGSQGAQRINDLVFLILPDMLKEFEIIHQCGTKNFQSAANESRVVAKGDFAKYYHIFPFLRENELREAYFNADIIVSRAGSSAIFTIAALGKPSILIPLPESAQDHQVKNAYVFAEKGAGLSLEQENLTPQFFLEKLRLLSPGTEEAERMKTLAKEFAKPMAAKVIARYLLEYLMR